jgi:hypothetical protein
MDRDQQIVLQLIETHSGEWSWYQLARSNAGCELASDGKNLMQIIGSLKASAFIRETEGHVPGMPRYAITELGRAAIPRHT